MIESEIKKRLYTFFLKLQNEKEQKGEKFTRGDFYVSFTPKADRSVDGKIVSAWFRKTGKRLPTYDEWVRICKTYNVSMDYFILGKGSEQGSTPAPSNPFDDLTLRDYCRLLFVDMAEKFHATWKIIGDEKERDKTKRDADLKDLLDKKPSEAESASIEFSIPLEVVNPIDDVSGYPGGFTYLSKSSYELAHCAVGLSALHYAFQKANSTPLSVRYQAFDGVLGNVDKYGYVVPGNTTFTIYWPAGRGAFVADEDIPF